MFKKLSIQQQVENSLKKILHINRQGTLATIDYEMNGKQYKITVLYLGESMDVQLLFGISLFLS